MANAENTVEIDGVEFNPDNLLEAVKDVLDEPMGEGSSQYGNIIVDDDGYDDRIVNLVSISPTHVIPHVNPTEIINKCEEAIEEPFEEYLKSLPPLFEVVVDGSENWGNGYDALIRCQSGFTTTEVQSLIENSEIKVGQFATKGGVPTIGLTDQRDE